MNTKDIREQIETDWHQRPALDVDTLIWMLDRIDELERAVISLHEAGALALSRLEECAPHIPEYKEDGEWSRDDVEYAIERTGKILEETHTIVFEIFGRENEGNN